MMLVEENERGSFVLVFKVETFQQFEEHKFFSFTEEEDTCNGAV